MAETAKNQVGVYSWHFMPWPYLDESFERDHESGWITGTSIRPSEKLQLGATRDIGFGIEQIIQCQRAQAVDHQVSPMNIIEARTGSTTEDLMSHDDARQRRMATHLTDPVSQDLAN